jgi:GLPGLI family protein
MKRIFFTLSCAIAAACGLSAQNASAVDTSLFVVVYNYACHTQDADGQAVTDSLQMALQVGSKVNKFDSYYNYQVDTKQRQPLNIKDLLFDAPLLTEETHIFFQNYPEGHLTAVESMVPNLYQTDEALPQTKWTLADDTLTIGGYLCHKATGHLGGRTWTVWFADDIPSAAGPWKLRGLPGLILQASDEGGVHSFVFNGLKKETQAIVFKNTAKAMKTPSAKFIKYRNKVLCNKRYPKEPVYYISPNEMTELCVFKGPSSGKGCLMINNMAVHSEAHVYQPLEME